MALRVTSDEVKEILDTSLGDASIEAFIRAANLTVTKWLGSSALSDAQLKEVERWLSAHFIACTRERQIKSEQAGDANITYEGKTDTGLDASFYGQQVKVLDTTGILAGQVGKRQATVYAVESFDDTGIDDE